MKKFLFLFVFLGVTNFINPGIAEAAACNNLTFSFSAPSTVVLGQVSSAITVNAEDTNTTCSLTAGAGQVVTLSDGAANGIFYSDAAGTIPVTTVTLTNGTSDTSHSATFYYKDTTLGVRTITASVDFDSSDPTKSITVTPVMDGAGTMTVTPASVTTGSTANNFVFTFTNNSGSNFNNSSILALTIPAGFPNPQKTTSGNAGYVTVANSTCSNNPSNGTTDISTSGNVVTINIEDCSNNDTFQLQYNNVTAPTANTYTFTTATRDGSSGTTNIAVSPVVTVNPVVQGTLIVEKKIIGDGAPQDFQFQVDAGTLTNFEADGSNQISVTSGTHSVTEPAISGYTNSLSGCTSVNVSSNGTSTCVITNTKTGNAISNPSLEEGLITAPTGWLKGDFIAHPGTQFNIVAGRFSDRAAQVVVPANPASGTDAKWVHPAVTVSAGQYYTFSLWYKSSTTTEVNLIENGGIFWASDLPASAEWTRWETSFIIPEGVTSLQVAAIIDTEGTLTTDDYQLVLGTAPLFDRGRVSLTFDDGWMSFFTHARPVLNSAGLKATAYINSEPVQSSFDSYMLAGELQAIKADGHDIGGHTTTHANLTLPTTNLVTEINDNKAYLESLNLSPLSSLAYPYGAYNQDVKDAALAANYLGARSVDEGYNFTTALTNPDEKFALKIQHVTNLTSTTTIRAWIDEAVANKTWLILMFHEIVNNYPADCVGADTTECTKKIVLEDTANYLVNQNVCVLTMHQALTNTSCNQAPVLDVIADQNVAVNSTLSFTAHATDLNPSDVLTYSISGGPVGSSINSTTGVFTWPTNISNVGTTTVTVSVNDGQGGIDSQIVNIEVLPDTVAPSVTLATGVASSTNATTIPVVVTFSESVSGFDNVDDLVITNATLDNFVASDASHYSFNLVPVADGEVTVKVIAGRATDLSSNLNTESNLLSVISDRTLPTIVLNGSEIMNITTADAYVEVGAIVTDIVNLSPVDISASLVITGTVNTTLPGTNVLSYNATDSAGNVAVTVTRTVNVSDQSGPVISVPSDIVEEAVDANGKVVTYTLPTATDGVDGDVSASVSCTPASDTQFAIGENTVSCTASDLAGNTSSASFKITVADTIAPVVTAPASQTFEATGPLTTPTLVQATTTDTVDANPVLTYSPQSFNVGTTTVTWTSTDASGNVGTAQSEVVITDSGAPIITLNGSNIIFVITNDPYIDLGATASDIVDGTVLVTNDSGTVVNTAVEDTYIVTYNAVDTEGNPATPVTRTVVVSSLEVSAETNTSTETNSITLTWVTSHPATSRIVWDTVSHNPVVVAGPNYGYASSTVEDPTLVTNHSVTVDGLSAGTQYFLRPVSHGSPEVLGDEFDITTGNPPAPVPPTSGGGGGGGGMGGRRTQATTVTNLTTGQVLGASTVGGSFKFTLTISIGSTGNEVTELQKRLTLEGVYSGPVTGYFGPLTQTAVKAYQAKHGLDQVGIVGPKTRAELNGGVVLGASTGAMTIEEMKALLEQLRAQLAELTNKLGMSK